MTSLLKHIRDLVTVEHTRGGRKKTANKQHTSYDTRSAVRVSKYRHVPDAEAVDYNVIVGSTFYLM